MNIDIGKAILVLLTWKRALNHIHLKSIPSTQTYLIDNFDHPKEGILISTDTQTAGKGQYERHWKDFSGSLHFSFTLKINPVATLSSLEIGILIKEFILKNFKIDIKLKWPNDLMKINEKKCGGILINRYGTSDLVVGIGINLCPIPMNQKFSADAVFDYDFEFSNKDLSKEIYTYILANRLSSKEVIEKWNQSCIHLNKSVEIKESTQIT